MVTWSSSDQKDGSAQQNDDDDEEPRRKRRRLTFAASADHSTTPAAATRITCWEEALGKDVPLADRLKTRSRVVRRKAVPGNDIVYLAIARNSGIAEDGQQEKTKLGPNIIAVFGDGEVKAWNEDLEEITLRREDVDASSVEEKVEKAILITADAAGTGILKGRDDVMAIVDATGDKELLITASHEGPCASKTAQSALVVKVLALRVDTESRSITSDMRPSITKIATFTLPEPVDFFARKGEFWFDDCAGRLYQQVDRSLAVFDLTGTTPRLEWLVKVDKKVRSLLPLSSKTIITASSTVLSIVDTRYSSVLGSGPLENTSTKTDRTAGEQALVSGGLVKLLFFSPTLGLLVAHLGKNIVTFQLGGSDSENRLHPRKARNMLADAVEHGTRLRLHHQNPSFNLHDASRLGHVSVPGALGKYWTAKGSPIDGLIAAGSRDTVDDVVCKELEIESPNPWADEALHRNRFKVRALLNKIFSLKKLATNQGPATPRGLEINILPPRFIQWLASNGFLTLEHIELAMKECRALSITESLSPGALIEALYAHDTSMTLLNALLDSPLVLSPIEIACAVNFAISALRQTGDKLLEQKQQQQQQQQQQHSAIDFIQPASADILVTDTALAHHLSPPKADTDVPKEPHNIIRQCLVRMKNTPFTALRSALASVFPSTASLLDLVSYFRLALAHNAWFSGSMNDASPIVAEIVARAAQGDDDGSSSSGGSSSEFHKLPSGLVAASTVLLNATFDVLGERASREYSGTTTAHNGHHSLLSNHVSGGAAELDEDLLGHMRTEIGAVVAGIEETASFANMVGEFLVYANRETLWAPPATTSTHPYRVTKSRRRNRGRGKSGSSLTKTTTSARAMTKPITIVGQYIDGSGRLRSGTLGAGNAEVNALSIGVERQGGGDSGGLFASRSAAGKTRGRESLLLAKRQLMKVSGGGKVSRRSTRDIGQQKSRRVGPHTFERVVL